jgi:hypothetical protein
VCNSCNVLIVGSTFRISILSKKSLVLGWKRWALRRTDDSKDRALCHSLAPEIADGNRSDGPELRLSGGSRRMLHGSRKVSFFSVQKGNFPPFLFLSLTRFQPA